MPRKTGIKAKVFDPKAFRDTLEEAMLEVVSDWHRRYVLPATIRNAPIYQGPDPREYWHPKGLLKRYLGLVRTKTESGKEYLTTGIPGATGMGTTSDADKAWIITQVLHRGWVAPKARTKPMYFAVWRKELINPEVETNPPEGFKEDPNIAWIFITFARPQERITLNPFHIRAFQANVSRLVYMLNARVGKKLPRMRIKFKRVVVLG